MITTAEMYNSLVGVILIPVVFISVSIFINIIQNIARFFKKGDQ